MQKMCCDFSAFLARGFGARKTSAVNYVNVCMCNLCNVTEFRASRRILNDDQGTE